MSPSQTETTTLHLFEENVDFLCCSGDRELEEIEDFSYRPRRIKDDDVSGGDEISHFQESTEESQSKR